MCIWHKSRRGPVWVRKEEGEDRKDDGRCMCVTTRTCACHNEVLILCAHQGRKRNRNTVTFNSQCWPGAAATGTENEDPGGGRSGGPSLLLLQFFCTEQCARGFLWDVYGEAWAHAMFCGESIKECVHHELHTVPSWRLCERAKCAFICVLNELKDIKKFGEICHSFQSPVLKLGF